MKFIAKYVTFPYPSIQKAMNNLHLLDILLVDSHINLDSHLEPLNFNPNKLLPMYIDIRLYLSSPLTDPMH